MARDPDLQRMIDEIKEIERMRDELRRMRQFGTRSSQSFPFDLLEAIIRGTLAVLERTIQRGVTASLDYFSRQRKK